MLGPNIYTEFSAHRYIGSRIEVKTYIHTSRRCECLTSLLAVVKEAIIPFDVEYIYGFVMLGGL